MIFALFIYTMQGMLAQAHAHKLESLFVHTLESGKRLPRSMLFLIHTLIYTLTRIIFY